MIKLKLHKVASSLILYFFCTDLKNVQGVWLKSLQLYPMNEGTTIYFKIDSDGLVLYGVDGEFGGILFKNVDTSQSLWVILEAYGSVQALKFVSKLI